MPSLRWLSCMTLIAVVGLGCSDQVSSPTAVPNDALAPLLNQGNAPAAKARNFVAPLSGAEEVPPADTDARGLARFQLSRDGTAIEYRLIVANIENVTMAHIHVAPAGQNGPVVVWLYPEGPPPQLIEGRTNGNLATGSFTAADLVGSLAGAELDALLELINDGWTYVNVHTSQFRAGEVRGQIRVAGPGR